MSHRRTPTQRSVLALPAAALLGLALLGCGSQDGAAEDASASDQPSDSVAATDSTDAAEPTEPTESTEPTEAPSSSAALDLPACDEVWVDGETLERAYQGCLDGDEPMLPERLPCSFGGSIVTYDNRYYAVPGKVINDETNLDTSKAFDRAAAACLA